jgi:uncharacterized protein GlcG (DUF336 family)
MATTRDIFKTSLTAPRALTTIKAAVLNFVSSACSLDAPSRYHSPPGGVAIKRGNEIVAGLGVGGAPGGDRDEACAQEGVAKIAARVNADR